MAGCWSAADSYGCLSPAESGILLAALELMGANAKKRVKLRFFLLTARPGFSKIFVGINRLRQPRNAIGTRVRLLTIKCRKRHNPLKEDTDLNTYMAKASDVQRKWYIVDAEGVVLGRLASQVASILRGKNKPTYTPHVDTGDYVIVINADKVILTGKKLDQKIYYKHSGFPGGLSETPYRRLLNEKPEFVIQHAVIGMLPKGPLGRKMAKKLKVYAGAEHEHAAQQPETLVIK